MSPLTSADVSIIVPVHNGGEYFARCLASLAALAPPAGELILVDDGSRDGSQSLAQRSGARLLHTACPGSGPATARNLGAANAAGSILFFVDADVQLSPEAVRRVVDTFRSEPGLSALFGSYDGEPAADNFVSQYKNLFHHFIHQNAARHSSSFWAGCGAIRREVFEAAGGFRTTYRRPSVEDIELGYRMWQLGYSTLLVKSLQVTHLKRWTLRSLLETDMRDRAIPWTILMLRERVIPADLNLKWPYRFSVILAYFALAFLVGTFASAVCLLLAALCAAGMLLLNARLYRFFAARRGWTFTLAAIALHWFYYIYSGLGFALGILLWLAVRSTRQ
jgi:glycosyltransferase involved in cell wall biosynthesis